MKTIKELAPKPSDAIQAMIDGLREQEARQDFRISMNTFLGIGARYGKVVCFGCAATCTIQKLAGYNFVPNQFSPDTFAEFSGLQFTGISEDARHEIISQHLADNDESIDDFEVAIDHFRQGDPEPLFYFYDIFTDSVEPDENWELNNTDWQNQLPRVEAYVKQLRELGL